jgi:hypothetical protein
MSTNRTKPIRTARIVIASAMALAVVGALSLFNAANGGTEFPAAVTEPATVIATSCGGFSADARRLFDKGGGAVLSGTFAAGDHVHLAIDLWNAGYSWETTGALGEGPHMSPSLLWLALFKTTHWNSDTTTTFTPASASAPASVSTVSSGKINGAGRWELEFDVVTAGDGALTINQIGGVLMQTPPKVAIASCTPRKGASVAAG